MICEKFNLCFKTPEKEREIKEELSAIKIKLDIRDIASLQANSYIPFLRQLLINLKSLDEKITFVLGADIKLRSCEKVKNVVLKLCENAEYIQSTRRQFNSQVSIYNRSIAVFPNSIIAHTIASGPCEYIHIDDLTEETAKIS